MRVFVDTYPAQPTIVIFGAVHIGVALAQLAKAIGGFRVVVVDARGVWATPERFPDADEIHVMHADDYLKGHPLGSNAYVAVLSHDPKLDDPALFGALQSDARYVGAVGSSKTQRERRERLTAAGLTDEQMDRLHGPIGLDLGAQSPEEIGVSILAQMIAAKNGKLPTATAADAQRCRRGGGLELGHGAGRRHPRRWRLQPNGATQATAAIPRHVAAAAGDRYGAWRAGAEQVIVVLGHAADQLHARSARRPARRSCSTTSGWRA